MEPQAESVKRYAAFISYSHKSDGAFAPALQDCVQGLGRHWRRRRALEVFRDDTGLTVNPDLWASISAALDGADWFVLLASPAAAASTWVGEEIERFVRVHGVERVILVLSEGALDWDAAANDFTADSTAVHPKLRGLLRGAPPIIDLRWAHGRDDLTLRNVQFRQAVAEIAGRIHGTSGPAMLEEHRRQTQRRRRAISAVGAVLAVLSFAAVIASATAAANRTEARDERRAAEAEANRAEQEAAIALSREFAFLSRTSGPVDLARLLAVRAYRFDDTEDATGALIEARAGTSEFGTADGTPLPSDVILQNPVSVSSNGSLAVVLTSSGTPRNDGQPIPTGVVDLSSGEVSALPAVTPSWISPEGDLVISGDGAVIEVDGASPTGVRVPVPESSPSFDQSGARAAYAAVGTGSQLVEVDGQVRRIPQTETDIVVTDFAAARSWSLTLPGSPCGFGCSSADIPVVLSPDGLRIAVRIDDVLTVLRLDEEALVAAWTVRLRAPGPVAFVDAETIVAGDGAQLYFLSAADGDEVSPAVPGPASLGRPHPSGGFRVVATCSAALLLDPIGFGTVAELTHAGFVEEGGGCDRTTDAVWFGSGSNLLLAARQGDGFDEVPCSVAGVCGWVTSADPEVLVDELCELVDRDLTAQEWSSVLPDLEYEGTCS